MFSVRFYIPGLTKKEPGFAGCTNATCNGLLKWADGTDYAHVPGMQLTLIQFLQPFARELVIIRIL